MPVIVNTYPKGDVGETTSSVNTADEMKSDTVDLDTHAGLSIILGLRPEGKEISVKVPKTMDELIEIMTPHKSSDRTLLIDCEGFDSDLTHTAVALTDCAIIPSENSSTEYIGLMYSDEVLDEISSIMGTDITVHLCLCKVSPNKEKFPKLNAVLPSFKHLKLVKSRVSARAEFEDVIKTRMGIIESVHGRYLTGGKKVIALIEEISHLIENNRQ